MHTSVSGLCLILSQLRMWCRRRWGKKRVLGHEDVLQICIDSAARVGSPAWRRRRKARNHYPARATTINVCVCDRGRTRRTVVGAVVFPAAAHSSSCVLTIVSRLSEIRPERPTSSASGQYAVGRPRPWRSRFRQTSRPVPLPPAGTRPDLAKAHRNTRTVSPLPTPYQRRRHIASG